MLGGVSRLPLVQKTIRFAGCKFYVRPVLGQRGAHFLLLGEVISRLAGCGSRFAKGAAHVSVETRQRLGAGLQRLNILQRCCARGAERAPEAILQGAVASFEVIPWSRKGLLASLLEGGETRPPAFGDDGARRAPAPTLPGCAGSEFDKLAVPGRKGREIEAPEVGQGSGFVPHAPALVVARVPVGDQGRVAQISLRAGQGRLGQAGLPHQSCCGWPHPDEAARPRPVLSRAGFEENPDQKARAER